MFPAREERTIRQQQIGIFFKDFGAGNPRSAGSNSVIRREGFAVFGGRFAGVSLEDFVEMRNRLKTAGERHLADLYERISRQGLGFAYWTDLQRWEGHPAVAVLKGLDPVILDDLNVHFEQVSEPHRLNIVSTGARPRTVYLINCRGYRPWPERVIGSGG